MSTLRVKRLENYISHVLDSNQALKDVMRRAFRDLLIWGDITPETHALKEQVLKEIKRDAEA